MPCCVAGASPFGPTTATLLTAAAASGRAAFAFLSSTSDWRAASRLRACLEQMRSMPTVAERASRYVGRR